MSLSEALESILPDYKKSVRTKKRIKNKHRNNLESLEEDGKLNSNFSSEYALGGRSRKFHHQTVKYIENNGDIDKGGYEMPEECKNKTKNLIERTLLRIRLDIHITRIKWLFLIVSVMMLLPAVLVIKILQLVVA